MAERYLQRPNDPEDGWILELSPDEMQTVMQALYLSLSRAVRRRESPDDSTGIRAAAEEHDLRALLDDLEPVETNDE